METITPSPVTSISEASRKSKRSGIVFGLIFATAGCGFLIPVAILPACHMMAARSWTQVPCKILSASVHRHPGHKGTTYSIDVRYAYKVGKTPYVGTRYDFSIGSSSGYDYRAHIVDNLLRHRKQICFVNPSDPADSVLDRTPSRDMWFALLPLLFIGVGIGMMIAAVRSGRSAAVAATHPHRPGPVMLHEQQSPLAALAVIIAICIFWNGIVGVFVYNFFPRAAHSAFDAFGAVFMIPFVAIGLLLIGLVIRQFLALFNPRPQLMVGRHDLALGESTEIRWSFAGNYSRITRLTVHLQGREQTRSNQRSSKGSGSNIQTSTRVFLSVPLLETTRATEISSGRKPITIPAASMHSFDAPNNKIIWTIAMKGEIARWPDVKSEYVLNVLPLRQTGGM